ncbi:MAG: hypothetical protein CM15mP120_03990 [Pseudomonadota bacterium]|nr:MAG: hypothetical protein CM15mP120_03990 [Pseudomonadota bacterium]
MKPYVEDTQMLALDSIQGHDSFLVDMDQFRPAIAGFLVRAKTAKRNKYRLGNDLLTIWCTQFANGGSSRIARSLQRHNTLFSAVWRHRGQ